MKGKAVVMKIIVYGIGEYYRNNKHKLPSGLEIVAYADSNPNCARSEERRVGKECT